MRIKKVLSVILTGCMLVTALPGGIANSKKVLAAENGSLQNGTLTENFEGWTIGGDFVNLPDDGSYAYDFAGGYMSIYTNEGVEKADFSLTQTVENMAEGEYYTRVSVVGNGNKGASESQDNLTLTMKDDTTGAQQSVKLTTDGWDNWDNAPATESLTVAEGDDVTITISGSMLGKDWYGLKNVQILKSTEAVEASINVQKVEGLSEDFAHGVDVSSYLSLVQSGAKYYDENGKEANLFDIMENAGINYVRLRVWNSPYPLDADGNYIYVEEDGTTTHKAAEVAKTTENELGYKEYYLENGTRVYQETYGAGVCDVETASIIGKIATDHHMKVLVDFHYSDFWADPKKKSCPKAWEGMTLEQKAEALGTFTEESLTTMKNAGVDIGMVQIGNEINNGMSGENDSADVYTLLKAGSAAVRKVSKDILIAVHFTDPQSEGYQLGRAAELEAAGVEYDAFGTSFYPFWHGNADTLYEDLKEISDTYNKKVYVAEISYAWTMDDGDGYGNVVYGGATDQDYNYSIDMEGQATAVRDAIAAVSKIGENGMGTFYWEPAWIPVNYAYNEDGTLNEEAYKANQKAWKLFGSGWASVYANEYDPEVVDDNNGGTWDNQAFFDFEGHVLDSINVYKYVYTGAVGPTKVATVDKASCEMDYHTQAALPKTVTVNLNNGTTLDAAVTWDAKEVAALADADFGEYTVNGTVGEFSFDNHGETVTVSSGTYSTTCTVTVTGTNYVTNGGFETGDAAGWTLTNYLGENVGWPSVDKSSANAKSGTYYYKAWNEGSIDFSIDQTIESGLQSGEYTLFAYYQGTGVDTLSKDSQLYATVTSKDGTKKTYSTDVEIHNVWKDFFQAKINGIAIDENVASVSVGTRIACTATELGAWVVIDDISLMRTGDLSAAQKYTVSYNVNGGKKLKVASKTVTAGKTYGKLAVPQREGYTFSGWYTKKNGGKKITSATKVSLTKDITLYAHWKKVAAPAKVKGVTAKKASLTKAQISYKKVASVSGYEIRYSANKNMKNAKTVITASTSKKISGLKKGKTYYVQVRAYKVDSAGKKVYSKKYSTKVKVSL